jgi:curved DNA-binding protein CbpA
MTTLDPFTALGLPARPDLSDEQVRAAWRAIATATHPDRPDGGDPVRCTAPGCRLPGPAPAKRQLDASVVRDRLKLLALLHCSADFADPLEDERRDAG